MNWDENNKPLINLYQLIARKTHIPWKDMAERPLIVSNCKAHYGAVSHWFLSVQGTPPRGTIIFGTDRYTPPKCWLLLQQTMKSITGKDYWIVDEFIKTLNAAGTEAAEGSPP